MELIERVKSIFGADLEKYLNELNLGPKDRVIVLLGETGHRKSTFINKIKIQYTM
jgi:putative ribosome biogenesis GTPase RsgA